MGQARGGSGTTMALHEAAAMRADSGQAPEAFYETAWLLLSAGASPFTERSDGKACADQMATFLVLGSCTAVRAVPWSTKSYVVFILCAGLHRLH